MSKFLCFIGLHDWSIAYYYVSFKQVFIVYMLCVRCGKCAQEKEIPRNEN